ncbi:MAG TPA: bifunctional folylpolyglutamate synthase/dihydrofolate synthase, partial [Bacillota bacterium]|nr:bifunctional folylpolyglutamate synthase/dihydrofolate synthase [Bacillota bacterium]
MNYEETIEKIHGFQKFGSRLGLERMTVLMDLLGNPQDRMKVIHVAGTNG